MLSAVKTVCRLTYRIAGAVGACLGPEDLEERQMAFCWIHSTRWPAFEQAVDASRASSWLDPGLSGGGAYPPLNVFRKGDDFIVIAKLQGCRSRISTCR